MRVTLAGFFELQQRRGILKDTSPEMAARVFLWILISYFRSEEIMRPGGMKKEAMEKNIREIIDIFMYGTLKTNQILTHLSGRTAHVRT